MQEQNADESQFMAEIHSEQNQFPLVGPLRSPQELKLQYEEASSPFFVDGIDYLKDQYPTFRQIRGDGNCFYRSFLFAYLEELLTFYLDESRRDDAVKEHDRIKSVLTDSQTFLVEQGYSLATFVDFFEELSELVEKLFGMSRETLLGAFLGVESSYYTWYMRLLTAGFLRKNADRFAPFLNCDVDEFCRNEVEPMDIECEEFQVRALCEHLGVCARIEYLDGKALDDQGQLRCIETASSGDALCPFKVCLLYRPGHYDILYNHP
jgi:ubiquitin thioesterase protein OTUB1